MRNQVHLIAYADRFGGSLAGLTRLLRGPFAGVFGGVLTWEHRGQMTTDVGPRDLG